MRRWGVGPFLLFLVLGAQDSRPAAQCSPWVCEASGGPTTLQGPKTCNCTSNPITTQICHTSSMSLSASISLSGGGMGVGFGGSVQNTFQGCITSQIPPGKCQFWEYEIQCFDCTRTCVLLFGWVETMRVCETTKATLKEEDADCT